MRHFLLQYLLTTLTYEHIVLVRNAGLNITFETHFDFIMCLVNRSSPFSSLDLGGARRSSSDPGGFWAPGVGLGDLHQRVATGEGFSRTGQLDLMVLELIIEKEHEETIKNNMVQGGKGPDMTWFSHTFFTCLYCVFGPVGLCLSEPRFVARIGRPSDRSPGVRAGPSRAGMCGEVPGRSVDDQLTHVNSMQWELPVLSVLSLYTCDN